MYELRHLYRATKREAVRDWNAFNDELEAKRSHPQYREPTLEDAWALCESLCAAGIDYSDAVSSIDEVTLVAVKQLGFVRKVQP